MLRKAGKIAEKLGGAKDGESGEGMWRMLPKIAALNEANVSEKTKGEGGHYMYMIIDYE
ncbi:uncharacterized protein G2W53_011990 [Senna tora]|uniref:Uncharacterized protein n=1 Tax=Senna tora TaxID=362788 RepID=A0A834WPB6_9FABA|nr:uncharacterized protein G2W53_011990 [Senna tora]